MGKHLWIISELYYPEGTSTGYILTAIAEGLARRFAVNVLCGQPTYSARGTRAPRFETRNGVNIVRCTGTTLDKNVLWRKLINLISISLSLFIQALARIQHGDSVLVVTNPPALPFLVALVCELRRAKLLLLIHDVYPDVVVASGLWRRESFLNHLGTQLNRYLYRRAVRIIVLGRDMRDLAFMRVKAEERWRVVTIPNWADVDEVRPLPAEENLLRKELGLEGKFVVEYAGNMGYPNDMESILEAAAELMRSPEVHFLFIGTGTKRKLVERAINERKLTNITLLPGRPRSDQENFLNACDIAVISLVNGMTGVSVPSRVYNTMAAGKPILAIMDRESEVAQIVTEEMCGWVIPPGRPSDVCRAILEAKANPDVRALMAERARLAAVQKYSSDRIAQAYESLMASSDLMPSEA